MAEGLFQQYPGAERLDREIEIIAGLTEAYVQAVVSGDLRSGDAARTVVLEDPVALRSGGVIPAAQTLGTGEQNRLPAAQPGQITGALRVSDRGEHPVEQLLHRHMTEAAVQVVALVARMAGRGEVVHHAHVVREGQAAGHGGAVGELELVSIGIALDEEIEGIADHPWEPPQLEEDVVDREIERIHHPVLTFVHDPERSPVVPQQLGTAEVAVGGLGDQELLVVVQLRAGEFAVAPGRDPLVVRAVRQAMPEHVLEIAEDAGVGITRRDAGGDHAALEETQHQREAPLLPCRDGEDQPRLAADQQQSAGVAMLWRKDVEALARLDRRSRQGGVTEIWTDGETEQAVIGVLERAEKSVRLAHAEHQLGIGRARPVVEFDPTIEVGREREARRRLGQLRGIGQLGKRAQQREAKPVIPRPPGVAGPAERALILGRCERIEILRRLGGGGLACKRDFGRLGRSEKRQEPPAGVGGGTIADVDVLAGRAPQRLPEPSRVAHQTDGETRKSSERRVLSVETFRREGRAHAGAILSRAGRCSTDFRDIPACRISGWAHPDRGRSSRVP